MLLVCDAVGMDYGIFLLEVCVVKQGSFSRSLCWRLEGLPQLAECFAKPAQALRTGGHVPAQGWQLPLHQHAPQLDLTKWLLLQKWISVTLFRWM